MPSSRQYRSTSQSPTRQNLTSDDLLSHLSPMNAVETLRSPIGSLKACMEAATVTEQNFALRAAVASKNIYEWLDELREWPWPAEGGGLGFQTSAPKSKEISARGRAGSVTTNDQEQGLAAQNDSYIGSLPAADVLRYERRVDEIQQEMEELNFEEIKRHVLHNHIFPLSRPGTPVSPTLDHSSSMPSIQFIVKMDDLTAVITATVVQALPNLSRLMRLMNTWTVRLMVLRRVPAMLSSLADAESAVQSGWSTIRQGVTKQARSSADQSAQKSTVSRGDFDVMKLVLEKEVAQAGRNLDYMLDTLEGREDTLPDDWCDRMDALERDYSDWVAACERIIRDAEFGGSKEKATQNANTPTESEQAGIATTADENLDDKQKCVNGVENALVENRLGDVVEPSSTQPDAESSNSSTSQVVIHVHPADDEYHGSRGDGDIATDSNGAQGPDFLHPSVEDTDAYKGSPTISITNERGTTEDTDDTAGDSQSSDADFDITDEFPQYDSNASEREPSLPAFPENASRPGTATTVISPTSQHVDTPDGGSSPPCTPPRGNTRSSSMCLSDMPTVIEHSDDEDLVETPSGSSSLGDNSNSSSERLGSPIVMAKGQGKPTSADEHLQNQISEILDKIPAKIHLSTEPARINHLNPPDLQLPFTKPKPMAARPVRSYSSMSGRAVTPAFMLAPAPRPRHQRGNQDIKMYHLSRTTGEAPIKLFIRCVGENGERVMVRVGGGWADLGEYLKEYAIHHGRRSHVGGDSKVEIRDLPRSASSNGFRSQSEYSPPSRPGSAMDSPSPIHVRKTRKKSVGAEDLLGPKLPNTPMALSRRSPEPPSSGSGSTGRSRSSSHASWTEDDRTLGMAGPKSKNKEIPEESLAWIESIKEKVRAASDNHVDKKFGEIGKVGGTKRLFRKASGQK